MNKKNKTESYEILNYGCKVDLNQKEKKVKTQAVADLKEIANYLNNACVDPEIKFSVDKEIKYGYEVYSLNMNAPKIEVNSVHLYVLQAFAYMTINDVGCDTLSVFPGLEMTADQLSMQAAHSDGITTD